MRNSEAMIRQWWYTYIRVLRGSIPMAELDELTKEMEESGLIKLGLPAPRSGAEDLSRDAYEILRK